MKNNISGKIFDEIDYKSKMYRCIECDLKFKSKPKICEHCKNKKFEICFVYNLDKILYYKFFIHIILGPRDWGKSFAVAALRSIKMWKKKKYKTQWLKRYTTQYEHTLDPFKKLGFKIDSKGVFVEHNLKDENGKFIKKEKEYFIKLVSLSTIDNKRGGDFIDYNILVLDEYGSESGKEINNEITLFDSLIETTFRRRLNCEVWIISNNTNPYLPIFQMAEINWNEEFSFNWKKDIITHILPSKNEKLKGSSARYLENSEYANYAFKNESLKKDDEWLILRSEIKFIDSWFYIGFQKIIAKVLIFGEKWIIDFTQEKVNISEKKFYVCDNISMIYFVKKINEAFISELKNKYWKKQILFTTDFLKNEFLFKTLPTIIY